MIILGEGSQPLWPRYPAAQQRLRAALVDAVYPRAGDVDAMIEPCEAGWRVNVRVSDRDVVFSEIFSAAELRAFRGRWEAWCSEIAAQCRDA
jgi:hypothetical protein